MRRRLGSRLAVLSNLLLCSVAVAARLEPVPMKPAPWSAAEMTSVPKQPAKTLVLREPGSAHAFILQEPIFHVKVRNRGTQKLTGSVFADCAGPGTPEGM